MKKLIITIISLIIFLLTFIIIIKGVKIGNFSIKSYKQIKEISLKLDKNLTKATKLAGVTFPKETSNLKKAINKFEILKEEYESKTEHSNQTNSLILSEIEKYEIEFLWTIIGNYATSEGINLTLDIVQGTGEDIYNLNFKLTGSYVGMTDFVYDIENDQRLNFKIEGLKMELTNIIVEQDSATKTTKENTTNINNTVNTNTTINTNKTNTTAIKLSSKQTTKELLQTTFSVNNISINLKTI